MCVRIKMNMNTAIWHFLENTDFCEWWQLSVLKQVLCDPKLKIAALKNAYFFWRALCQRTFLLSFLGVRDRSSLFQKGQKGTWSNIVLCEVQWFFLELWILLQKYVSEGPIILFLTDKILCIILLELFGFHKYLKLCNMSQKSD